MEIWNALTSFHFSALIAEQHLYATIDTITLIGIGNGSAHVISY